MPLSPAWQFDQLGNAVEAALWMSVAAALLTRAAIRHDAYRTLACAAAGVFVAFGLTDVVEIYTRAWYRPWWLFTANAICVIGIAVCWWRYRSIRRSLRNE